MRDDTMEIDADQLKVIHLDNDRNIWAMTNEDATFNPLVILFPQWSKTSLDLMPKVRQEEIYEKFIHEIGIAWEKLLREK